MEALSEGWTVEGKATMEEKPGRQTIGRKPATVDSHQGVAVCLQVTTFELRASAKLANKKNLPRNDHHHHGQTN